jgi:hypothetical protein
MGRRHTKSVDTHIQNSRLDQSSNHLLSHYSNIELL